MPSSRSTTASGDRPSSASDLRNSDLAGSNLTLASLDSANLRNAALDHARCAQADLRNADLNGTIALSVVAITCWFYFVMRYTGPVLVFKDLFGNKADKAEVPSIIYYPLFLIFFAVGIIEVISIAFRPISLSLRLFGNAPIPRCVFRG